MTETVAGASGHSGEGNDCHARTTSDSDFPAEKDASSEEIEQVTVCENEAEQRKDGPITMYKTMNILYEDAKNSHTFQWDARVSSENFLQDVRRHFRIPRPIHIKWKDDSGAFVVYDDSVPAGSYAITCSFDELKFEDLVHETKDQKKTPKKFGEALLAIKRADSFLTLERAWLGWVRVVVQLSVLTVVFLLRLTWHKPTIEFERAVIVVSAFLAVVNVACFAVGWYRYKRSIKLIQDPSNYTITEEPDHGSPEIWLDRLVWALGLVLATSGAVALFPFYHQHVSSLSYFSR